MVLLIFLVFSFSLLYVISSQVSGDVSATQNIKRNRKKSAKKTCIKIKCLLKLGKSEDVIKYICLVFISFLPLFYLCYIYYFGSLIFCCHFIIPGRIAFGNLYFKDYISITLIPFSYNLD